MIAVTGANGLLGSFVVRKLLEVNEPFVALKREHADTSLLNDILDKIEWRHADILDVESLDDAMRDVRSVIHCAALVSFNPSDKKKILAVNVFGTRNVVNSCISRNVNRLLHVSSVTALGRHKDLNQIDEKQKWMDSPLNTAYAKSKYMAELEVIRGKEEGLNVVIVNPSVILAPGISNRSSARIFHYVWDERKFYTDGQMNYVSVQDTVEIIYRLLHSPFAGERYIASAGVVAYKGLLEKIASNFNKRPPSVELNGGLLTFLGWIENLRSGIAGSEPLVTAEMLRFAKSPVYFKNEKIRNELNFEFQTIDQTLKWCCEYYVRQLNGKK
jgi:nucleoside-diphosphate-sugar epimerase